jgi:hypothetical protein
MKARDHAQRFLNARVSGATDFLYADYGQNAVWHIEGGLGSRSAVVKFQLRPDPLAK